jgi:anti-sigma-K factor RskA
MRRLSTGIRDALALDEAVGLMHPSAARRYESYARADELAAQARRAWRRRALRLLGAVAPRPPPPTLLATLRRRLKESPGARG